MTYDFRKTAIVYSWFIIDEKPNRVLYGPFPNEHAARAAFLRTFDFSIVGQMIEKYGSWWQRKLHALPRTSKLYVSTVGEEDLEALLSDPESAGYKTVKVKPATALKIHPGWKGEENYQLSLKFTQPR